LEWVRQKALKGLEIGCLAFVDVAAGTAMHAWLSKLHLPKSLKAEDKTLVTHYVSLIKNTFRHKAITCYLR
jgi:hypothetical protein